MGWENSNFEGLWVYFVEIPLFANLSIKASIYKAFAYISWVARGADEAPCRLKITFPDDEIYIFHIQLFFFVKIAIFMEKKTGIGRPQG